MSASIVDNSTMALESRITLNALKIMSLLYESMEGEHYGLSIIKATGIGNGTLYPILDKLEEGGLISASWEAVDTQVVKRRPRRYYRLTADGIKRYEAERAHFLPSSRKGLPHV